MKKIILLMAMLALSAFASKPLVISAKQENWKDPFVYILEDVRNYQWIANKTVLRIWFYSGKILDLSIGNYEVKIK